MYRLSALVVGIFLPGSRCLVSNQQFWSVGRRNSVTGTKFDVCGIRCLHYCISRALFFVDESATAFASGRLPGFGTTHPSPRRHCSSSLLHSSSSVEPTTSDNQIDSSIMDLKKGVAEIVDQFDVFLLDMWGVMHDGFRPYEGVLDVVQQLRQANKKLIILSNSSKRRDNSIKMLTKLGFNPEDFDGIITSGEVAHWMLSGKLPQKWAIMDNLQQDESKRKVFVFGSGDNDEEYCNSRGWTLAPMEEANLIVARGTFTVNGMFVEFINTVGEPMYFLAHNVCFFLFFFGTNSDGRVVVSKRDDEEAYESALEECLQQAALRQIPMLVTNPDKIRPDAERPPMPGKIGDRYEEILQTTMSKEPVELVKRIGKPFQDVYDIALTEQSKPEERSRVCMVGDALETDIVGGATNGISTVWVLLDGVYGPDLETTPSDNLMDAATEIVHDFNGQTGTYAGDRTVQPDIVLRHFCW